jgi:hypothetical protein
VLTSINPPNNSDRRIDGSPETAPDLPANKIRKVGNAGRKRRYEEPGIDGIPPIREVIIFRWKTGHHWPGMSGDMQSWYEHYYFTKPKLAEKAKDAKEYERHVKSWERGRAWIETEDLEALSDSRKIIAIRRTHHER